MKASVPNGMDALTKTLLENNYNLPAENHGLFKQLQTLITVFTQKEPTKEHILQLMQLVNTIQNDMQLLKSKLQEFQKHEDLIQCLIQLKTNNELLPITTSKQQKEENLFWSAFVLKNPFSINSGTKKIVVYLEVKDLLYDLFDTMRGKYAAFMMQSMLIFTDLYKVKFSKAELGAFLDTLRSIYCQLNPDVVTA